MSDNEEVLYESDDETETEVETEFYQPPTPMSTPLLSYTPPPSLRQTDIRRDVLAASSLPQSSGPSSGLSFAEETAANFEASGRLSVSEIARAAGLRYRELAAARQRPEYVDHVRKVLEEATLVSRAHAIATRAGRISQLQRTHDLLAQVQETRAAAADPRYCPNDPQTLHALGISNPEALIRDFPDLGELYDPTNPACLMVDPPSFYAPGAATGLLTRTQKQVGVGANARIVDEWSLDNSLITAQLSIAKRAAEETGQSNEDAQGFTQKMYINIDMSRL